MDSSYDFFNVRLFLITLLTGYANGWYCIYKQTRVTGFATSILRLCLLHYWYCRQDSQNSTGYQFYSSYGFDLAIFSAAFLIVPEESHFAEFAGVITYMQTYSYISHFLHLIPLNTPILSTLSNNFLHRIARILHFVSLSKKNTKINETGPMFFLCGLYILL